MTMTCPVNIEKVETVGARDVYHVRMTRRLSADDVADQVGLTNFADYELRRVAPQADGSLTAELWTTCNHWDED